MSYLNSGNSSGMDHPSSNSLLGGIGGVDRAGGMMGDPGGMDMSMLGGGRGGVDLLHGGAAGMLGNEQDLLHGHGSAVDGTDFSSIYPGFMGSGGNHVTNTQHKHGYGHGPHSSITNSASSSSALHNGYISNYDILGGASSHLQQQSHELHRFRPIHRQDSYYNNNEQKQGVFGVGGNLLGQGASTSTFSKSTDYLDRYDSSQEGYGLLHQPTALLNSSSLLSQRERDLIAQAVNKGSSAIDIDSGRSGLRSGRTGVGGRAGAGVGIGIGRRSALSTSAPAQDPYFLDDPADYLIRQRQQEDYGQLGSSSAFQSQNLQSASTASTLHLHNPTQTQTHRPVSAPLYTQNQNQYNRNSQPGYPTGVHTPASNHAHAASNYNDTNLRYNNTNSSNNYSNATNSNAHYLPGRGEDPSGSGFGGIFGGRNSSNNNAGSSSVPGYVQGGMGSGPNSGMGEVQQQSLSSESQAYYGNETMVKELRPEFVRWFYRYEQERKWTSFTGYDSIRIESKYREVFRDQMCSYSHSAYYPVASFNDESTDFSRFCPGMNQQFGGNNNMGMDGGGGMMGPGNMMQQKWWPGKGAGTTVDTEFNNGGIGFPPHMRNNSAGTNIFGRNNGNGGVVNVSKEKMLHKANSASALLGGPGSINGMTSSSASHHPTDMNKVVVVREGLYEVDLNTWTCFSTYWPGDTCLVTRGTWFFDGTWDPLPVEQAEKLEEAHMAKFCGATLLNSHQQNNASGQQGGGGQNYPHHHPQEDMQNKGAAAAAPALHRISFNDFHVDWTSPTDVFWYSAATSHKLMRSVGQKLGFSDWGHRICRGYYKPALIVDRPSEIGHIVFVIHGIGQKMDTGRIVRNCSAFRDCVSSMKDKYFPQLNNAKQRAEFFPVEWRSAAKLDGDVVDAIIPQKLVSLRQLLNSTAMDIMYYTSPLYRAEIQNALIDELNRIYANFVKRNPNFVLNGGKVSVMAHSLGAVITYDIVTGYLCGSVVDDIAMMQQQYHQMPRRVMPQQQGLLFTLEHFFFLGSPLSVFLALRWREPHDPNLRSQILPHHLCKRIYNVFYSSDPVAYRLEPLLNRHYAKVAPVTIHAYNAPVKPRYSDMPRERITIVSKTATDNIATINNTSATSNLPVPNLGDNLMSMGGVSMSSLKPPSMPSMPSLPKPSLPSVMKMPPSPNKAGGGGPDQQSNNNWGGWFGGNIMKLWKGSTSPAAGFLDQAGIGQFTGMSGIGGQQTPDPSMVGGGNPNAAGHMGHPTNPVDEAAFLAQTKENYSTVVDEELSNIPNDLEVRLDYALRESQFSGSGYIAALTSHTAYWTSVDTAYFVMTHLYDDLIEQSSSSSGER